MTAFDPRALRHAFGTFMTGVTVVTTHDAEGNPLGFTANSFTSVSIDPALVLVCIANSSLNYDAFATTKGFAVNILSEGQVDVSNTFARPSDDRFASISWRRGPFGAPLIDGVSAWFDCSSFNTVEAGDHLILIGKVEAFDATTAPGLGYARGAYVTPAAEAEALNRATNLVVSALIERDGKVLLQGDAQGHLTLPETRSGKSGATAALARLIEDSGVAADPGFVYSVYEDEDREHQHIVFLCHAGEGTPTHGVFTDLTPSTLTDVADPAMCSMLDRFARESRLGNFGVYVGNQSRGTVRPISSEGE